MSTTPKSLLRDPVKAPIEQERTGLHAVAFRVPHSPMMVVPLHSALAALAAVTAERDALRANAERYRWLRDNVLSLDAVGDPDNFVRVWHGTNPAHTTCGRSLDQAIDDAMCKEQSK